MAERDCQACWACGTIVKLPTAGGQPVPLFKCGWCQAYINYNPQHLTCAGAVTCKDTQRQLQLPAAKPAAPLVQARVAGGMMLAIVCCLIGYVVIVGSAILVPGAYSTWSLLLHYPITFFLALNVVYNYAACVVKNPGSSESLVRDAVPTGTAVPEGAFESYTFCASCQYYKPPRAHHCRKCGTCVVDLDHHCWYLGNQCVGAANLRSFIRFLAWLVLSVQYALLTAAAMGWNKRRLLLWHTSNVWQHGSGSGMAWRLISFSLRWSLSAPLWMALYGLFVGLCSMTLVLVGMLLQRQLVLLLRGQRYLDVLKYQQQMHVQQYTNMPGAAEVGESCGAAGSSADSGAASEGSGGSGRGTVAAQQQPLGGSMGVQGVSNACRATRNAVHGAKDGDGVVPPRGVPAAWWESARGRSMRGVFGDGHPFSWLLPFECMGESRHGKKLS